MNISLRYCAMWNYEPRAVSLASLILSTLKQKVSRFELIPSDGGCFELTVDGRTIYSKLETGEFPNEDAILAQVGA